MYRYTTKVLILLIGIIAFPMFLSIMSNTSLSIRSILLIGGIIIILIISLTNLKQK
jgi:hypothetical protein